MSQHAVTRTVCINNPQGLHARPAELFAKLAMGFESDIEVIKDDRRVDAKSILHILTLGAEHGTELIVEARTKDYAECRVVQAGRVGSRQGVNLPGVRLSVPAMDHHDREAAQWAAAREVDFISLSFVRSPNDLIELKQLLHEAGSDALVIAKIEKAEAIVAGEATVV